MGKFGKIAKRVADTFVGVAEQVTGIDVPMLGGNPPSGATGFGPALGQTWGNGGTTARSGPDFSSGNGFADGFAGSPMDSGTGPTGTAGACSCSSKNDCWSKRRQEAAAKRTQCNAMRKDVREQLKYQGCPSAVRPYKRRSYRRTYRRTYRRSTPTRMYCSPATTSRKRPYSGSSTYAKRRRYS